MIILGFWGLQGLTLIWNDGFARFGNGLHDKKKLMCLWGSLHCELECCISSISCPGAWREVTDCFFDIFMHISWNYMIDTILNLGKEHYHLLPKFGSSRHRHRSVSLNYSLN